MTKHAQYSPSKLKQIMACPGCVQLEAIAQKKGRIVEQQSEAAAHGTMLHERMESIIKDSGYGQITVHPTFEVFEACTSDLEIGDKLLLKNALEYFYNCMEGCSEEDVVYWALEEQVSMKDFDFPQVYGTPDALVLFKDRLLIFDWKFGRTPVNAKDNPQLQAYLHGAYSHLTSFRAVHADMPIEAHIVQPQIDNYQKWETGLDLKWCGELRHCIDDAESQDPTFAPSAENCLWCKCKSFCDARLTQVQENAQKVFAILAQSPDLWEEDKVQFLLGQLQALQKVGKGILADYEARAKEGKKVPGFKLVKGQGRRGFIDYKDVIAFLDEECPDVEAFEAKPLSPAKLEKLIPAKVRNSPEFQELIKTTHGIKFVPDTHGGEEIKRGYEAAQEAFKEFV